MAVAKIKRLEIIGLQKDKEELLRLLRRFGLVQLINIQTEETPTPAATTYSDTDLLKIEEAISNLGAFREKASALEGIVRFKPLLYERQLQEVIARFDYRGVIDELAKLRNQLKEISSQKERLLEERQLLSPWRKLRLTLEEIHYKNHCGIILGKLNIRDYETLLEDIEKNEISTFVEIVDEERPNLYLSVFYLAKDFERLEVILKDYHFNFVTLPHHEAAIKERLFDINSEILILVDAAEDLKDKMAGFANEQFKLMMAYDYFKNVKMAEEADKNLAKQQFTFTLSGWIREKDEKLLARELSAQFKNIAIFISEPKPDEAVPVTLENKPLVQPFEFITGIYGMPKYNEIDPTPFLAPFFFLYFGLCISDVGYGLMLMAISYFALKRFRMGVQGVKFFKLFFFCGISTVIVGALMGSWFGNLLDIIAEGNEFLSPVKRFKDSLTLLDPLRQPTKLLGIVLCLGIIQVWFGNIVAAIGNIKNRRYLDIIFDQATMLTFLFGLTGLGLIFLNLLDKTHATLFKYSALLGAIALILTQGRFEKGLGSKLFFGAYNLYSALSGYLSDILSYSRLWALGLVTGVMANTVNLISIEFSRILVVTIPFISKITFLKIIISGLFLAVIFIAGHTVSFMMNLLGAFVHPVRLQFVEFFSKFFKSGGSTFKPFKIETKYVDIN